MAQLTNSQPSATPQTSKDEHSRRKARFRILQDGTHEHNLVDMRTKVTISDTLRNLIKPKWQKQQDRNAEEAMKASRSRMLTVQQFRYTSIPMAEVVSWYLHRFKRGTRSPFSTQSVTHFMLGRCGLCAIPETLLISSTSLTNKVFILSILA
jgi:hypothetical protein